MQFTKSLALLLSVAFCEAQFASPRAGDVLQIDQEIQIQWQTQGLTAPININLVPSDVTDLTVIAQQIAVQINNVGSLAWIPDISITAFQSFSMIITDSAQVTIISQSFQISQLTQQPVLQTISKPVVQDIVATRANGDLITSTLTTFDAAVVTGAAGPIKVFYSGSETPKAFVQTPIGVPGAGVVAAIATATPTASAAGQVAQVGNGAGQLQPLPGLQADAPLSLIPLPGLQTGAVQGSLRPLPGTFTPPTPPTPPTAVAAGEVVTQTAVQGGLVPLAPLPAAPAPPTAVAAGEVVTQTAVQGGLVPLVPLAPPPPAAAVASTQPTAVAAGDVVIQTAVQGGFVTLVPAGNQSVVVGGSLIASTTPTAVAAGQVAIQTASIGSFSIIPTVAPAVVPGTSTGLLPLAPLTSPVASFASAAGVAGASPIPLPNGPNRFSNGTVGAAGALSTLIPGVASPSGAAGSSQLQPLPGSGPVGGEPGALQPLSQGGSQPTDSGSLSPLGATGAGGLSISTSVIRPTGAGGIPGATGPANGGLSAQTTNTITDLSAGYRISSKGGLTAVGGAVITLLITFAL